LILATGSTKTREKPSFDTTTTTEIITDFAKSGPSVELLSCHPRVYHIIYVIS